MGGGGEKFVWRWFESDISDNTGGHRHSNLVNVFYIIPLLPDIGCFYKAGLSTFDGHQCFKKHMA